MYLSLRSSKVKVYTAKLIVLVLFSGVIQYGAAASVKAFKPDVYIVTPEPASEYEGRNFQPFLPTPLPDEESPAKHEESSAVKYTRRRTTTTGPPDIIIAEFREGSKNGTGTEKMLSVKEMLSKEMVPGRFYVTPVEYTTSTTARSTTKKDNVMDVKDVWDIIKHNQDLETTPRPRTTEKPRSKPVALVRARKPILPYPPPADSQEYTVETVKSVSADSDAWMSAEPESPELLIKKPSQPIAVTIDEPRTIRGGSNFADSSLPARVSYYPAYRRPDTGFADIAGSGNNYRVATGEAEDRYNPAQPYLPPHNTPEETKKPLMPPPPVPMPPPPPPPQPQPYMNAPSISYDSIPSYSPPDSSKPDTSGPPSDSYNYPSPDDSGPPPSFDSSDDHHPPHHDDFKFESPPDNHDSDNYPQLIYEDHHPHHDDHDHDHIVYHHHHHTTTTPAPPPPPTTAAPEVEDTRVTNRFSYYYLGKKLWYLPLYFSVYFIVYVGALIIKSIARHKITYPQHFKTKRSLGFSISEDDLHNLTRLTCNALFNAAEKYLKKS